MKILIVDDHALFREGLCHILRELEKQITILEAHDHDQALKHISTNPDIDMVLLDLELPGKDGFMTLRRITQQYSALPVVILSASKQHSDIQQALNSGAMGYITKDTTSVIMLSAIQLVLSGGIYIPKNITQLNHKTSFNKAKNIYGLTPRKIEVLTLLIGGHSNKYIAQELQLAEATIKVHITSILKALGVSNRTQAAMKAKKLGLALT